MFCNLLNRSKNCRLPIDVFSAHGFFSTQINVFLASFSHQLIHIFTPAFFLSDKAAINFKGTDFPLFLRTMSCRRPFLIRQPLCFGSRRWRENETKNWLSRLTNRYAIRINGVGFWWATKGYRYAPVCDHRNLYKKFSKRTLSLIIFRNIITYIVYDLITHD